MWNANGKARVNLSAANEAAPRWSPSITETTELAPSGQTRAATPNIAAYPVNAIPRNDNYF